MSTGEIFHWIHVALLGKKVSELFHANKYFRLCLSASEARFVNFLTAEKVDIVASNTEKLLWSGSYFTSFAQF